MPMHSKAVLPCLFTLFCLVTLYPPYLLRAQQLELLTQIPEVSGQVHALMMHEGILYLGGNFDRVGDIPCQNLAAVELRTGEVLRHLPPVTGGGRRKVAIRTLAITGEWLWLGGGFTHVGDEKIHHLAGIHLPTGTLHPTLGAANNEVYALEVSGTGLLIGGTFSMLGHEARSKVAIFDLISQQLRDFAPQINGTVIDMEVWGTRLYLGGNFSEVSGQTCSNLAVLDTATGQTAEALPRIARQVNTLSINQDRLIIGGWFDEVEGLARNKLASLDLNTLQLTPLQPQIASALPVGSVMVSDAAAWQEGLLVGGHFNQVNASWAAHICWLEPNLGSVLPLDVRCDAEVSVLATKGDTAVFGGAFSEVNGIQQQGLAGIRLIPDRQLQARKRPAPQWAVYPNPFQARLMLRTQPGMPVPCTYLHLHDVSGQELTAELKCIPEDNHRYRLIVPDTAPGLYRLEFRHRSETWQVPLWREEP